MVESAAIRMSRFRAQALALGNAEALFAQEHQELTGHYR
jgi:hypothetical protein